MPKTYTTKSGDCWDAIAYSLFPNEGRELLTSYLIDANPQHIHTVIFPAGVVLNIPEADIPTSTNLPPWMT